MHFIGSALLESLSLWESLYLLTTQAPPLTGWAV